MRCYCHLHHANHVLSDREGIEVDDPEVARTVALWTLAEMLLDGEVQAFQLEGWCLVVTDAADATLFTVNLDLLLH